MNRRSFFGMFGALSAVTAAGLILPEPIKSYCFFESPERFCVRQVKIYDIISMRGFSRIDIVRQDSPAFKLEPPLSVDCTRLVSGVPERRLAEVLNKLSGIEGLPFKVPTLFEQHTVSY